MCERLVKPRIEVARSTSACCTVPPVGSFFSSLGMGGCPEDSKSQDPHEFPRNSRESPTLYILKILFPVTEAAHSNTKDAT